MRAVIAEDMTILRQQAVRILTELGIEVVAACRNGKEAVDACADAKPDFVILDILMPVMGGDVAAPIIMRDNTAKYVVIVSSQAQDGILKPLRAIGCFTCLKPYDHRQLTCELTSISPELLHQVLCRKIEQVIENPTRDLRELFCGLSPKFKDSIAHPKSDVQIILDRLPSDIVQSLLTLQV